MEFKISDRVRIVEPESDLNGQLGTIASIDDHPTLPIEVQLDEDPSGFTVPFGPHELELADVLQAVQ